jgi:tetratricopeptide (TPR) repeat protein
VTAPGPGELAGLLAGGEHAAFHGKPADAVATLERAVVLATSQGRAPEVTAAAWLLGVALGAAGRYGGALTVLSPLVDGGRGPDAGPDHRVFAALAGSTIASVQRQLGRHAVARHADQSALDLTDGTGPAAFDAQLGLAADAVGLGELDEASERAAVAAGLIPGGSGEWWRQRVRLGWVQADIALLEGRPDEAAAAADAAVRRAEDAGAPRHVAKGLLYLALAQVSGDDPDHQGAVPTLRRAAALAEALGAVPLIWPTRALLGALAGALTGPAARAESERSLAAARGAVTTIAADLPPRVRGEWLARPDVSALMARSASSS